MKITKKKNKIKQMNKELTLDARRFLILTDISNGERYNDMVRKYMEQWGVSHTTVELYINDAIAYMRSEKTKENFVSMNMERLDDIIAGALKDGDRRSAIKAIDTQNKLAGGYEEKVKIESDNEINLVFDIGE